MQKLAFLFAALCPLMLANSDRLEKQVATSIRLQRTLKEGQTSTYEVRARKHEALDKGSCYDEDASGQIEEVVTSLDPSGNRATATRAFSNVRFTRGWSGWGGGNSSYPTVEAGKETGELFPDNEFRLDGRGGIRYGGLANMLEPLVGFDGEWLLGTWLPDEVVRKGEQWTLRTSTSYSSEPTLIDRFKGEAYYDGQEVWEILTEGHTKGSSATMSVGDLTEYSKDVEGRTLFRETDGVPVYVDWTLKMHFDGYEGLTKDRRRSQDDQVYTLTIRRTK